MQAREASYQGKHFTIPDLSKSGFTISGNADNITQPLPQESLVLRDLNTTWDLKKFLEPRAPVPVAQLKPEELTEFGRWGLPRVLDMPIKFPGTEYRIPKELEQLRTVIQKVADFEAKINPDLQSLYYCYLTVDQGVVAPNRLQREAPCHVDGFQGARWDPKVMINHSYTLGDALPTKYYVQPFDFTNLDARKHNFFWEMNRQVALTNSQYAVQPRVGEITMMDAYCVHRGTEADMDTPRTWVRLSFEVRVFDRLGNAHNPLFDYDWPMVKRDIEGLGLVAYDPSSDPSLRVFPWQDQDGNALPKGQKSSPNLKPQAGALSDLVLPPRPEAGIE